MKKHILCLDDSVVELELLKNILHKKSENIIADFFISPESAIRSIKAKEYDVMIMDYQLPKTTGLEILDIAQRTETNAQTPVIILTGEGDESIAVSAMKKGAFDYFVKGSIDHSLFLRTITHAIDKKELELKQRAMDLERERMQMKMISQSKLASLGEMATGAAHEIFQPLSVIRGNIELLASDMEDQRLDIEEWISVIPTLYKNIDRIQLIVDRLKVFGKEKEKKAELIALFEILDNVSFFWESKLKKEKIQFTKEYSGDSPFLMVEKGEMEQVFINILQNSFDALEHKKGDKEIKIYVNQISNENKIAIVIEDNGRGISEENLVKAFEPFFTTKEGNQGMGLGLSIAYATVHNYSGSIEVFSKENEYTRVIIRMPIKNQK